jgi:hypothetical protein
VTDFITIFAPGIIIALTVAMGEMLYKFIKGSRAGKHVDRIAYSAKAFDEAIGENWKPQTWDF